MICDQLLIIWSKTLCSKLPPLDLFSVLLSFSGNLFLTIDGTQTYHLSLKFCLKLFSPFDTAVNSRNCKFSFQSWNCIEAIFHGYRVSKV